MSQTSSDKAKHQNHLYHEATRRAALAQPIFLYSKEKSLLLTAPNNIIFELFNTVIRETSGERLMEFIRNHMVEYLGENWKNKTTQRVVARLKQEQAVDSKAGLVGIPIIREPTASNIHEHVMWRIRTGHVSQITSLLVKLILDDGYRSGKLKAEVYEDVKSCFEDWRSDKLIKLYSFGNAPANDQRLLLSSTSAGDLTKWVANYIDGSEKQQNNLLIRKLADALRDRTKNNIYITNDIKDAIRSFHAGSIRCVIVVDRLKRYTKELERLVADMADLKHLITGGKIYIVCSLNAIEFAPDPTNENCC